MTNLLEQVSKHRKEIRYEHLTTSVSELLGMYTATPKEIQIKPSFQRLFRWSRKQQTDLIESIILEIPIPPLFFYEDPDDGSWELLDGLQRISTLIRFMAAEVDLPEECKGIEGNTSEYHEIYADKLNVPLQLLPGEYLSYLEGKTYQDLPTNLKLNFKRARLHIYVLKRETDKQYKYEVFKRINRGGSTLEDQEVRNCSVRLLDPVIPDFLQEIGANETFLQVLSLTSSKEKSGYTEELALRYLAFKNNSENFSHNVNDFLDEYMAGIANNKFTFDVKLERNIFLRTFEAINKALSDGEAFKGKENGKSKGPFAPSIFETISIGVAHNIDYIETLDANILREKILDAINFIKNHGYSGGGSNSRSKVKARIEYGKQTFSKQP